jgi:ribonuclease PH
LRENTMKRFDGRDANTLRQIKVTTNYLNHRDGSVLIEFGGTKVLCSVTITPGIPGWMRAQKVKGGWLTSEYGMLPASTHSRSNREAVRGKQSGRTLEIQRLIGRSFRTVVDLLAIGQNTVYIDCDVIDADGGTRCASITGASIALQLAFAKCVKEKRLKKNPMREHVSAVSVGIVDGRALLDLCYEEDSKAEVDMNVVMTESGKFIELQGTAEGEPFDDKQLAELIASAKLGLKTITHIQKKYTNPKPKTAHNKKEKPTYKPKDLGGLGDAFSDAGL